MPADVIYCDAEKTEKGIYFRYRNKDVKARFIKDKRLMISYDELRENDVFFFEYVKNTYIENVRIIHGAGMGIVGQCCENMHLNQYVVSPQDDDLYSTTADGILLTNFTGKVRIENCLVDRSIDDAISVHGFYTRVEKITDYKKAIVRLVHYSQSGTNIYFPGDVLRISDENSMNETGRITVKKAYLRENPSLIYLEFDEEVEGKIKVGDYLGNDDRTPEIEIRNCVFNDFPAIRLSSSKKTVFENNVVKNCNALLVNDLMRYWSVTGCVNDLTIQNNTFENCGTAVRIIVDRLAESTVKHKNIKIIGNTIKNCKNGIVAEHVENLEIRDNIFEGVEEKIVVKNCINEKIQ